MSADPEHCFVCGTRSAPDFIKDFGGCHGLGEVEYWRCPKCGLVYSHTHRCMSAASWQDLNRKVHEAYQGGDVAPDDPRWRSRLGRQADALATLHDAGLLDSSRPWVDYACGDGRLADQLTGRGIPTARFDRYMQSGNGRYLKEQELSPGAFSNVISTSFLEHVLQRQPLDEMAGLVAGDGALSVHTLVRERVPRDPSWFYLFPVHVALFANRSMEVLFSEWGFTCSVYHLPATLWVWFRGKDDVVESFVREAETVTPETWFFKRGFADYWRE